MKIKLLTALQLLILPAAFGQTTLTTGHTDIAIGFDEVSQSWDLFVGVDSTGAEYAAADTILSVQAGTLTVVPGAPKFNFLGAAGKPIWILPQTQSEEILYLGYGGEDIPTGVFVADEVMVTLKGVTGPGSFFSYKTDMFGNPVIYFNSADGLTSDDRITIQAGGEAHSNWAFTASGTYEVTLQVSGILIAGGATTSAPVTFIFNVVEPLARLDHQHTDLHVSYDSTAKHPLIVLARDREHHIHYPADKTLLVLKEASKLDLPAGTPFGNEGDSMWIIPQGQDPNLLYLGISSDSLPTGVFDGGLNFRLMAFDGPGQFFLWQANSRGNLNIKMQTYDGLSDADKTTLIIPSHEHYNWGFSTNGTYHLTLQASGTRIGESTPVTSAPTVFTFIVEPLPLPSIPPPLQVWRDKNWPVGTSALITGNDFDPDFDGIPNVLEYVFGSNPNEADAVSPLRFSFVSTGGKSYGTMSFSKSVKAINVTYTVEATTDIAGSWQPITTVVSAIPNDEGTVERITIRDSIDLGAAATRFYRVRFLLTP